MITYIYWIFKDKWIKALYKRISYYNSTQLNQYQRSCKCKSLVQVIKLLIKVLYKHQLKFKVCRLKVIWALFVIQKYRKQFTHLAVMSRSQNICRISHHQKSRIVSKWKKRFQSLIKFLQRIKLNKMYNGLEMGSISQSIKVKHLFRWKVV